ncbi:MAG TPA: hypothetical protein VG714_10270 [Acidobacteriaceae bacterium]|nr:hypothetical protein [Acidobacteriaceae bacterium]
MGISRDQALECLKSDDLIGLGMEADAARRRLHPEGVATYAVGCTADLWSLLAARSDAEERLDRALAQIGDSVAEGATGLRLLGAQNGAGCGMDGLEWLESVLREMRHQFPALWIEGFPAAEAAELARSCGLSLRELALRLHDAGLDAIAGDGPNLADPVAAAEWLGVHGAAHAAGMATVAGVVFGAGETPEQLADFLNDIRALQEQTGGFVAAAPLAVRAASGRQLDSVTAVQRLRTVAVARIFFDSIEHIQADGAVNGIDGLKVLQTALRFGANDLGMLAAQGSSRSEEDARRIIRDAGLRPAERDSAWRVRMLS